MTTDMSLPREVKPWRIYFLEMAKHVATRSKHPRSQHGAVLVDSNRRIVSTGYNGAPAGFPDSQVDWSPGMTWTSRDWTIHAEENALLQAGLEKAEGCELYVTGLPCPRCLLRIAQCRICWVCCGDASYSKEGEDFKLLMKFSRMTGVSIYRIKEDGSLDIVTERDG